ncbi:hypothetical protein RDI58_013795 [Solanum bulbocastanum]|uniref:Transmembrane protein n=1 Tax=Solanum bulbocastanum TaxID=147425 RepID=A0AAN8TLL9_SOLBU
MERSSLVPARLSRIRCSKEGTCFFALSFFLRLFRVNSDGLLCGIVECCWISFLPSTWARFISKITDFLFCSTRNSSKFIWVPMLSLPVVQLESFIMSFVLCVVFGFQFISLFGSFRLFIPIFL